MQESWQVLKKSVDKNGIKHLAHELKLSPALIYKWCQKPLSEDDPFSSGASNPLDRIRMIYEKTEDIDIVQWICQCADGFYCANPKKINKKNIIEDMQVIINEFSDLLKAASSSLDDNKISEQEADKIRKEWEELKTTGESMVISLESKFSGSSRKKGGKQ